MDLPAILLILAAISSGATVIAIIVSLRSAREARSAIFPIVREEESVRARRARVSIIGWLALTALFLGGWLATLSITPPNDTQLVSETDASAGSSPTAVIALATEASPVDPTQPAPTATRREADAEQPATATSALEPITNVSSEETSESATLTMTPTPEPPTNTPTPTPEPPPTATPTVTSTPEPPTATPTSLAEAARIPTVGPRTPAPPQAKMGPIQFGTGVTSDIEAINPDDLFSEDIEAVYAVYPYSGMEEGLDFTAVWYKDGVELVRDQEKWQFGDQFRSYRFLVPDGEGLYKLELYVNDSVLATGLFEIR